MLASEACPGCCDEGAFDGRGLPARGLCPPQEFGIDWVSFLRLVCAHCLAHATCVPQPELLAAAKRAVAVLQSGASFVCKRGALAALVVHSQFSPVAIPESLASDMNASGLPLSPFPLSTWQYALFTRLVPVGASFCNEEEAAAESYGARRFAPPADIRSTWCALQRTDQQLLRACRSRRARADVFAEALDPETVALLRTVASEAVINRTWDWDAADLKGRREGFHSLACPRPPERLELPSLAEDAGEDDGPLKYERRVLAGGCHSTRGLWGTSWEDSHKCVMLVVAERLGFRPGELLLEWGSGCGHAMSWAKMFFDVDGLGVDSSVGAVTWAQRFSAGRFCAIDGRELAWIPNNLFDYVFSYASLRHIPQPEQCKVGLQLVQKLRPGGKAFFGWNRAHDTSPWMWAECFHGMAARAAGIRVENFEVIEEWLLFASDRERVMDNFLWQYPAYSVMLTKQRV